MHPATDPLTARVQRAIVESGRSQKEVAAAIGMDATKLSKVLNMKRRLQHQEIEGVAQVLGLDPTWLRTGMPANPGLRCSDASGSTSNAREQPASTSSRNTQTDATQLTRSGTSTEPVPHTSAGINPSVGVSHRSKLDSATTAQASAASVPSQQSHRRTAILDAAGRLIARMGYHNVRMQDVAAECGVSTAAVHYHFSSRDLLLISAMEHVIGQDFQRNSDALATVSTSLDKLMLFVDMLLPVDDVMRDDWSLWLQFWTERITNESLRKLHNEFHAQWIGSVEHLVRRGQARGEFAPVNAQLFAATFAALADGLALRVLTRDPHVSPADMRAHLVTLVHDYLLPRRKSDHGTYPAAAD